MIMTRTPLRISLVGGGTDIPDFYEKNGYGAVVSFTIDKYVYVIVNKRFNNDIRVSYSKTEIVEYVDDIKHEIVRECLRKMGIPWGIEVVTVADIPGQGSGLGSSSAVTAGLLEALQQYNIMSGNDMSPIKDLAEAACEIEIDTLKKPIGKQDQYACARGGLNFFEFRSDGDVVQQALPMSARRKSELEDHLLLFYTGKSRKSAEVLQDQKHRMKGPAVQNSMLEMRNIAEMMKEAFIEGKLDDVGLLMHENWLIKRSLSNKISSKEIDDWYRIGREFGADGGKLCGAGGGGFMLFFARPEKHREIIKRMPLKHVPFKISRGGTRVAFMEGFND